MTVALGLIELAGGAFIMDLARLNIRVTDLSWSQACTIVRELLCDRRSATYRRLHPDDGEWDLHGMILADISDNLRYLLWGLAGGKGQKPERMPRPGLVKKQRIGADPIPIKDFDAWWSSQADSR